MLNTINELIRLDDAVHRLIEHWVAEAVANRTEAITRYNPQALFLFGFNHPNEIARLLEEAGLR